MLVASRNLVWFRLNPNSRDATILHFHHGEATPLKKYGFAFFGNVTEAHKQKTCQRFHASLARQAPLHLGFEVAKINTAIHQKCAGSRCKYRDSGRIELVFKFPGELLDGILGRHQANDGAVFINDDRHVTAPLLEVTNEVEYRFGFGNDEDVAHDLAKAELNEGSREARGWTRVRDFSGLCRRGETAQVSRYPFRCGAKEY